MLAEMIENGGYPAEECREVDHVTPGRRKQYQCTQVKEWNSNGERPMKYPASIVINPLQESNVTTRYKYQGYHCLRAVLYWTPI